MKREPQSPDSDTVIWRFMDDWKFTDMLKAFDEHERWKDDNGKKVTYYNKPGQLWFSYPWTLAEGEGGEGRFPEANADPETFCDRLAASLGLSDEEAGKKKEQFMNKDLFPFRDACFYMAQLCGVSCWHESESESERMWDCVENMNGVALKTTVSKLEHSLTWAHNSPARLAKPVFSRVGYGKHRCNFLLYDSYRDLLCLVDEKYIHEEEIRCIAKSSYFRMLPEKRISVSPSGLGGFEVKPPSWEEKSQHFSDVADKANEQFQEVRATGEEGFYLPISLKGLLDDVVISPTSDADFIEEVRSQLAEIGQANLQISRSQFY